MQIEFVLKFLQLISYNYCINLTVILYYLVYYRLIYPFFIHVITFLIFSTNIYSYKIFKKTLTNCETPIVRYLLNALELYCYLFHSPLEIFFMNWIPSTYNVFISYLTHCMECNKFKFKVSETNYYRNKETL